MDYSEHPVSPGSTSPSLIEGARANEPEAWRRLMSLYGSLVYSWCRKSGLQAADAADVTQSVFRNVSSAISRFEDKEDTSTFRGWLRIITSNRIRDWARAHAKLPHAAGGSTAMGQMALLADSEPESVLSHFNETPKNERLHEILAQVRSETEYRTWTAFWQTTVEGRPAGDVADELGMKRQAVFQAKSRTLKRLRVLLDAESTK